MKLKKVRLRNFCQHRDLKVEFHDGLNCIIGPNGAGKSNLLNGIVGALTNDFSRSHGNKLDNINALSDKEPSFVNVSLEHGGAKIEIFRGLYPPSHRMVVGPHSYDKNVEIKHRIAKVLGVSDQLLLDYVFVKQTGVAEIFEDDSTHRALALQKLFGIEKATKLYKLLGETQLDVPSLPVDPDFVSTRLKNARSKLEEARKNFATYDHLPADHASELARYQRILSDYESASRLTEQLERIDAEQKAELRKLHDLDEELGQLNQTCHDVDDYIRDNAQGCEQAREVLRNWESWREAASQHQEYSRRIRELEENKLAPPKKPTFYVKPNAPLVVERDRWASEKFRTERLLKAISADGLDYCPECGTKIQNLAVEVESYKNLNETASRHIVNIDNLINDSRAYDTAKEIYEVKLVLHETTRSELESKLELLSDVIRPEQSFDDATIAIAEFEKIVEGAKELRSQCSNLEYSISNLRNICTGRTVEYKRIHNEWICKSAVSEEEYKQAKRSLNTLPTQIVARSMLAGEIGALERQIEADEELLRACDDVQRSGARIRMLAKHLTEVRQVFHHDRLPLKVVRTNLLEMQNRINELLEFFGSPFTVRPLDGLNFEVTMPNGVKHPVTRLSRGQLCVFAMVFRIVINSMYAKDLGLLCLDEPTEGLDRDNMAYFKTALARLRELSESRGLQVILVTHAVFPDLFDRVIKLP